MSLITHTKIELINTGKIIINENPFYFSLHLFIKYYFIKSQDFYLLNLLRDITKSENEFKVFMIYINFSIYIYNSQITPNLMAFLPYYNNTNPYGKATPNRIGGELGVSTDTSNHVLDASVKGSFFTEVQGEGGDPKRQFLLVNGGANVHLGKMLDMTRIFDINFGARYENTTRTQGALVDLNSTLIDAGLTFELVKKLDFLAGMKSFTASGNEFIAKRNAFNAIVDYDEIFVDMNEMIYSVGIRARFNKHQMFTLNYNFTDMQNKFATANNYNFGQVFLHYRGIF